MKKYNTRQKYGKGWWYESQRHSLARHGIKTGRKDYARKSQSEAYKDIYNKLRTKEANPLESEFHNLSPKSEKFYKKLGSEYSKYWQGKIHYSKIDYSLMSKLQSFLHKKFDKSLQKQPEHIQQREDVIQAKEEIKNITNIEKLKLWAKKYKSTITFIGLGALAGVLALEVGVPTLMQNVNTGEIISVGGTLLGRTGNVASMVFTGLGAGEGLMTVTGGKQQITPTLEKVDMIKPEELKVEQKVLIYKVKPNENINYSSANPEYGNLSELSSKPIPFNNLTKEEQKTLYTSISKVKKLIRKHGKKIEFNSNNLQVCKRVGPDDTAFGAHQDNLIQIDRDTLKDRNKTEGVLLHEALHKVYGVRDETRELENIQIDYLGDLM